MLPEYVTAIELKRLARDIETDLAVLDIIADQVTNKGKHLETFSPENEAFLAVKLHAWYTGLESILERIARVLEGSVPTGPSSHQELLRNMTLPLSEVRPAIIPSELHPELSELLAFRHFFRHAYAVSLDEMKLRIHADCLTTLHPKVSESLMRFAETAVEWSRKIGTKSGQ